MDIMGGKYRIEWRDGVLQLLAKESQAAVEQTIARYYAALTDSPVDAKIRYTLGQLFRREGRLQTARQEYAEICQGSEQGEHKDDCAELLLRVAPTLLAS